MTITLEGLNDLISAVDALDKGADARYKMIIAKRAASNFNRTISWRSDVVSYLHMVPVRAADLHLTSTLKSLLKMKPFQVEHRGNTEADVIAKQVVETAKNIIDVISQYYDKIDVEALEQATQTTKDMVRSLRDIQRTFDDES